LPIPWDDLATGMRTCLRHRRGPSHGIFRSKRGDAPLVMVGASHPAPFRPLMVAPEPTESGHPALSEPSTAALDPAGLDRPTPSRPSTVALEPVEIGHPAPAMTSAVPPESAGGGRSDSSEPSESREGSKRQRADEEQPGSGWPAPKCPRMMASG